MIFANHAHIFEESVRPEGSITALLHQLDECGIDKAVCFAPFSSYFSGEAGKQNLWLAKEIRNNERLLGFGTIDFGYGHLAEQVQEIRECGLVGIKMHPAFQRFRVDGDNACEVYAEAEKQGLPISFHTGIHWHRISSYNTLLYDEVAYRFPKLKISMEHVGGYSFFNEAVAVMCNNKENVFGGLTSVFDREMNKYWYLGKEKVKDLWWLTGVERSVFGLDFPYNTAEQTKKDIQSIKECLSEMGYGKQEEDMVFGGNLLRLIGK